MKQEPLFGHEKLEVYQRSIEFAAWADLLLEEIPKNISVHGQLDRASTSVPLNIAEGNGKWNPKDRCHFFDIAWGSALESASSLDVLVAKRRANDDRIYEGKKILFEIVRMLIGLIKANDPDRAFGGDAWQGGCRVREDEFGGGYGVNGGGRGLGSSESI